MTGKLTITTSSWFTPLPDDHLRIGISRGTPRGMPAGYRRYTALQPGPWFRTASVDEYRRRYVAEVLDRLDPQRVVADLTAVSAGRIPTLVCFEQPDPGPDWCHRGLVSQWLHATLGLRVYEYGLEAHGFGNSHPKLPLEFRVCSTA